MARSVPLWIGKDDDAVPPPRVRLRVFQRWGGRCHKCGREIRPGERWTLEHLLALILGGKNAEDNLRCTCENCLPLKNAEDQAAKSKLADISKKHHLPKERSKGFRKPPGMKFDWSKGRYIRE